MADDRDSSLNKDDRSPSRHRDPVDQSTDGDNCGNEQQLQRAGGARNDNQGGVDQAGGNLDSLQQQQQLALQRVQPLLQLLESTRPRPEHSFLSRGLMDHEGRLREESRPPADAAARAAMLRAHEEYDRPESRRIAHDLSQRQRERQRRETRGGEELARSRRLRQQHQQELQHMPPQRRQEMLPMQPELRPVQPQQQHGRPQPGSAADLAEKIATLQRRVAELQNDGDGLLDEEKPAGWLETWRKTTDALDHLQQQLFNLQRRVVVPVPPRPAPRRPVEVVDDSPNGDDRVQLCNGSGQPPGEQDSEVVGREEWDQWFQELEQEAVAARQQMAQPAPGPMPAAQHNNQRRLLPPAQNYREDNREPIPSTSRPVAVVTLDGSPGTAAFSDQINDEQCDNDALDLLAELHDDYVPQMPQPGQSRGVVARTQDELMLWLQERQEETRQQMLHGPSPQPTHGLAPSTSTQPQQQRRRKMQQQRRLCKKYSVAGRQALAAEDEDFQPARRLGPVPVPAPPPRPVADPDAVPDHGDGNLSGSDLRDVNDFLAQRLHARPVQHDPWEPQRRLHPMLQQRQEETRQQMLHDPRLQPNHVLAPSTSTQSLPSSHSSGLPAMATQRRHRHPPAYPRVRPDHNAPWNESGVNPLGRFPDQTAQIAGVPPENRNLQQQRPRQRRRAPDVSNTHDDFEWSLGNPRATSRKRRGDKEDRDDSKRHRRESSEDSS